MATVVKNFRIKSGLIVEGTTGTINGQNILRETGSDTYILNLVGGATLVKSVETNTFNVDGTGKLTINANVFDAYGSASAAQTAAEATASADATSKANAAAASAIAAASTDATTKVAAEAALRVSGDAASVATAATDATTKADAAQAAAISAAATDATTKANAAKAGAEATAAAALSAAISTEVTNRNTAISDAVDSLVDGAPALLDTLNELAAAINDDANYATTMTTALAGKANASDVTTSLAGKQDNLTAGMGIDITGDTVSVAFDAGNGLAINGTNLTIDTNVISTKSYAEDVAGDAQTAAEATAATHANGLVDDLVDGTTWFTEVNLNGLVAQRAAQGLVGAPQSGSSMMSWAKSDYPSAKAWVKFNTATHSQISEVLITTDSSNNIAITEFGIVGTNGSLGSVSASYLNGNISIDVDTVEGATTVLVVATLIK